MHCVISKNGMRLGVLLSVVMKVIITWAEPGIAIPLGECYGVQEVHFCLCTD